MVGNIFKFEMIKKLLNGTGLMSIFQKKVINDILKRFLFDSFVFTEMKDIIVDSLRQENSSKY